MVVVFVFCVLVFVGASVRSERILREAPALPLLRVGPVAVAKTQPAMLEQIAAFLIGVRSCSSLADKEHLTLQILSVAC